MTESKIVLAGGCFWCIENDMRALEGVLEVVSGYTGDTAEKALYPLVSSGATKHREAVLVSFDAEIASFRMIVQFFLDHIDAGDGGGQFYDRGYQYEPVLYYKNQEEKKICEESLYELAESGLYDSIGVKIEEEKPFYRAEEYHQKYAGKNPEHYNSYKEASGRAAFVIKTCTIRDQKKILWKNKK
jgi:methionine-S-sulfoxide reductase